MIFDRIAILDWSAANRPRRGKDSIWLGHDSAPPENLPTRATAFDRLTALVEDALTRNQRLLIGADFAFGYPRGFARALTGQDNALALWQQLADRLQDDARNRSNRLEVAAEINRGLPGLGPFWFNPTKTDLPGLPRKGTARHGHGFTDLRGTDRTRGAQSVWKLGGAGAVGSQVLTGLPVLWRLRAAFPGRIAAWPFEPPAPVTLAEVFPSLLAAPVRAATAAGPVRDAVQVTLLARALATLDHQGALAPLLVPPPAPKDEGWILGLGAEAALNAACPPASWR